MANGGLFVGMGGVMNDDWHKQNGSKPIIDALLLRMCRLERFSDDGAIICDERLLPFDLVINENGEIGMVVQVVQNADEGFWLIKTAGNGNGIVSDKFGGMLRTIFETESLTVRNELEKIWGSDVLSP